MFSLYKISKPFHKIQIQKRAFFANPKLPNNNNDNIMLSLLLCVCYITYRNITKDPPKKPF